jgi:hypothetical protein
VVRLTRRKHVKGSLGKTTIMETVGSGVAPLDYDGDGWLDIYLVNGSTAAATQREGAAAACGAVSQQP